MAEMPTLMMKLAMPVPSPPSPQPSPKGRGGYFSPGGRGGNRRYAYFTLDRTVLVLQARTVYLLSTLDTPDGDELFSLPAIIRRPWGRPGFDVGCKADKGIPRTSHLVNQLESNSRQRRNLRSGRLRARLLTGRPVGRAGQPAEESFTRDRAAPGRLDQRQIKAARPDPACSVGVIRAKTQMTGLSM